MNIANGKEDEEINLISTNKWIYVNIKIWIQPVNYLDRNMNNLGNITFLKVNYNRFITININYRFYQCSMSSKKFNVMKKILHHTSFVFPR